MSQNFKIFNVNFIFITLYVRMDCITHFPLFLSVPFVNKCVIKKEIIFCCYMEGSQAKLVFTTGDIILWWFMIAIYMKLFRPNSDQHQLTKVTRVFKLG